MKRLVLLFCSLGLLLSGTVLPAVAEDYLLTIGGGYDPSGNQVSLEKNVLFYHRVLGELGIGAVPHDVFFADGESPGRDLQFADPTQELPRVHRLLAQVFGQTDNLDHQYRTSQVPNLRGGSNRENVERWFQETGRKLGADDRLIIYFTGHGGKGKPEQNPHFYLWENERMPVREFVALLDQMSAEVPVVLVMVQCYSGGFANTIFSDGEQDQGCTPANRCGFFATTHDRGAAGCTADIREENYEEYSSYFWSALCGQTRAGEAIELPDYDGDGAISFAEAHGYALLTATTIDIPVKTSDAFLRAYSVNDLDDDDAGLLIESTFDEILGASSPVESAVLTGLSAQLELEGDQRAEAAKERADALDRERKSVQKQRRAAQKEHSRHSQNVRTMLKLRWPELTNPWRPQLPELIARDEAELIAAIESHASYSELAQAAEQIEQLERRELDLEKSWVKCQRFLRTWENVVLAANLPHVAVAEQLARYEQLRAAEAAFLVAPRDASGDR